MSPIWVWIIMIIACVIMWYFGVYRFNKWLKKEEEEFVKLLRDNLELSNINSKVKAFNTCKRKL